MPLTTKTEYIDQLFFETDRVWTSYLHGLPLYGVLPVDTPLALVKDLYPEVRNARALARSVVRRLNAAVVPGDMFDARTQKFLAAVDAVGARVSYPYLNRNGIEGVLPGLTTVAYACLQPVGKRLGEQHLLMRVLFGLTLVDEHLARGTVEAISFGVTTNPATKQVLALLAEYLYAVDADR